MLKKLLIPMGLVSALGASTAMAAINLDALTAATVGTIAVATDSLLVTNSTAGVGANLGKTYYRVTNSGSNIDITGDVGVGFSVGDQLWVRYDITGGAFDGAVANTLATIDNQVIASGLNSVAQGGQDGASSVIFAHTVASNAIVQTSELALKLANVGWDGSSALGVTVSVYEKLSDSTSQTNAITTKTGTVLNGVLGVRVTTLAANETAEVGTLFTAFNAAGTDFVGTLGTISILPSHAATLANGGPSDAVDALDGADTIVADAITIAGATSLVTISGDFSFGTWGVDSGGACAGALTGPFTVAAGTLNAGKTAGIATAANFATLGALCVTASGTETIPIAAPYTASVVLAPVASRANAQAAVAGTLGSILHNGTTVQMPYLTTFADYNQRLVIVNRGTTDATYSVTFNSEAAATAVAGTAATGTIAAGTTSSIKVSDIVTMTGLTRTAGTLVVVAPAANLSVATNQVNLSDGSTDTVVLL